MGIFKSSAAFDGTKIILPTSALAGISADPSNPSARWTDLKGTYVVNSSGGSAPTREEFDTGIFKNGFNASDLITWRYHLLHDNIAEGKKYFHPHVGIARGAAASGSDLVFTHTIKHGFCNFPGTDRGSSPVPIVFTQTITPAQINAIGAGNEGVFELEVFNTGGTGGKLNSLLMLPDDFIDITTSFVSVPTITGGTSAKISVSDADFHIQTTCINGTVSANRAGVGNSFYVSP